MPVCQPGCPLADTAVTARACPLTPCASVQIQSQIIEQARVEQIPESSDSLFAYLIERVRNNLHIVLCLSPVGDPFR